MKNTLRSLLIAVLLGATPALLAQHAGSAGPAGGARMGGGAHVAGGFGHGGFGHSPGLGFRGAPVRPGVVGGFRFFPHGRGFRNPFFSPFLSGLYWWNDGNYPYDEEQAVQPPTYVVEQNAPAPQPVQEVPPASPLLIELQGNRFVRLSGNDANPALATAAGTPAAQQELPPVVLVFRDGHQQQVSSYSIIGPAIYASGSYWTNGYWTQKILLADLNLPATLRANQERGVNFVLPSAPNQVVTRP